RASTASRSNGCRLSLPIRRTRAPEPSGPKLPDLRALRPPCLPAPACHPATVRSNLYFSDVYPGPRSRKMDSLFCPCNLCCFAARLQGLLPTHSNRALILLIPWIGVVDSGGWARYFAYDQYSYPHSHIFNNVWHTVNYNSRLQPYQALDIINNENDKLLRAECLYWGGSYDLTACGATNHTDNNGNPRATVFWYGNGGTSVSASFNETFAYDGVNRLTGVVDNGGWSRYFAYDQYSNMWLCGWPGIAPNGSAPTATYCSKTPSGIFNNANQIIGRSYDGAGNMASLMGSNFSYDAENRITTAVQPGIGTVTYTYDGDGRRVMKAVSTGLQTVYVYDIGGKLVAEYSSGAVSVPPCHTCFLSTDHLGSTRLVTDENGNTVSRHGYIPFGEEIQANSGGRDGSFGTFDFVNQKFTGKERDQETGLDYFGARYYGSTMGRFMSPDDGSDQNPGNPQSWNLYSYGRNNPLIGRDDD